MRAPGFSQPSGRVGAHLTKGVPAFSRSTPPHHARSTPSRGARRHCEYVASACLRCRCEA
eukprot:4953383-Prymnesium_polylepis.1